MDASLLHRLPARPASEVEWEEVLIRFELMTRALRVALEGVEDGAEGPAADALRPLVEREARVAPWLLALADGDADPGARVPSRLDAAGSLASLAERFVGLRGRNFAMVQRRGLEVWGWEGEFPGLGRVSVHQLLWLLVEADARVLARLRETTGQGAPC